MFESPQSLQDVCIDFLCDSIQLLSESEDKNYNESIVRVFKDSGFYIPSNISERLLDCLSRRYKITDDMLILFDYQLTCLQRVHIKDASKLTSKGLSVLKSHKIVDLEVIRLGDSTVNDLIGSLGEWTLQKLQKLNVAQCTFVNSNKVQVVVALSKLKNLRCLNVSDTEFNYQGLEIITEDLPLLEELDISGTKIKDISPLKRCKDNLKYLNMYNLKIFNCSDYISVLNDLNHLCHLDISDDKDDPLEVISSIRYKVSDLLTSSATCLPQLVSLDISGKDGIHIDDLKRFLDNHPKLRFLGLMQTEACYDDMFTGENDKLYNPELKVSGCATEGQILESLRRYKTRRYYIQKSLYHLYSHTQNYPDVRIDVIKLVIFVMREHLRMLGIQMAATACVYNLTKGPLGPKVHPFWLKQIVDLTLIAMKNFPKHQQLQKNTLLTLCSDRILQDVTFDRYRCAISVMDALLMFNDPSMNRMSVAICSILAAKISTAQTSSLGTKRPYMEKLLNIVQVKTDEGEFDIMMKFTLSALWNLTDESPPTCTVFLDMGGMEIFLNVLEKFAGECAIETKVLGLLNNIAEVMHLRPYLMDNKFMTALRSLLRSSLVDVSYFAAGIVAHLTSDSSETWTCTSVSRKEIISELGDIVRNWQVPETEMVAYRSFTPFFPLLRCFETPEVQLWAVWAIHHVCTKNPKRYCPMLAEEDVINLLQELLHNVSLNELVAEYCWKIIHTVEQPLS